MISRRCHRCGKRFNEQNQIVCKSCREFFDYRKTMKYQYRKTMPDDSFQFELFERSVSKEYSKYGILHGHHEWDVTNPQFHVIKIHLFNLRGMVEPDAIKAICNAVNHEWMHYVLYEIEGTMACKAFDSIAKQLNDYL